MNIQAHNPTESPFTPSLTKILCRESNPETRENPFGNLLQDRENEYELLSGILELSSF